MSLPARAAAPTEPAAPPAYSQAYTRYVLGLVLLVMIFNNLDRTILSILVEPIRKEFDLSDAKMGAAMGLAFTLVYSLLSLPIARWADFGVRRSIVALGLFIWSGFTAGTALVKSYFQLFAMRMGVGIGEAAGTPASISLLSDYVPPGQRGRGLSVISIGAVTGMGLGMVAGGWINQRWGWRTAFLAAGAPGILLALAMRLTVREPMRGANESTSHSSEIPSVWRSVRHLLGLRTFQSILLANAVALFASMGRNLWEPAFLMRSYHLESGMAGTWYFAIAPVPSILGIYLGGALADRLGQRDARWYLWVPALGQIVSVPLLTAFLLLPAAQRVSLPGFEIPVAFLISIAGSVFGSFFTSPFIATVQSVSPLRMRALASAIMTTVSSFVGLAIGPLLVGIVSDRFKARFGEDALRYSLLIPTAAPLLSAVICALGAASARRELVRVR
jgi:MFS family permease